MKTESQQKSVIKAKWKIQYIFKQTVRLFAPIVTFPIPCCVVQFISIFNFLTFASLLNFIILLFYWIYWFDGARDCSILTELVWLTFVYGNHTEFIISIASIERRLRELWPLRLAIHSISQFKLVELHKIATWSYMGCSNNLWVVLLDPVAWLIFANAKKQRGGIKKLIKFTFIPEKALENARLMRPFERRWQWRWWWCWWPWWWWWWWWGERQLSLGDLNIDKHKTCPKRRDASTHPSQSQLKCHRISIQFARHGIR